MTLYPEPFTPARLPPAESRRVRTIVQALKLIDSDIAHLGRVVDHLSGHARHRAEIALAEARSQRAALWAEFDAMCEANARRAA